jgi:hypothetical protein
MFVNDSWGVLIKRSTEREVPKNLIRHFGGMFLKMQIRGPTKREVESSAKIIKRSTKSHEATLTCLREISCNFVDR